MVENQAELAYCKVLPRYSLQQTEKDNKDPQVRGVRILLAPEYRTQFLPGQDCTGLIRPIITTATSLLIHFQS